MAASLKWRLGCKVRKMKWKLAVWKSFWPYIIKAKARRIAQRILWEVTAAAVSARWRKGRKARGWEIVVELIRRRIEGIRQRFCKHLWDSGTAYPEDGYIEYRCTKCGGWKTEAWTR